MDPELGIITSKIVFDREAVEEYEFLVWVVDFGSPMMTASADVTVTIVDVNDNAPKLGKSVYTAVIFETSQFEDEPKNAQLVSTNTRKRVYVDSDRKIPLIDGKYSRILLFLNVS